MKKIKFSIKIIIVSMVSFVLYISCSKKDLEYSDKLQAAKQEAEILSMISNLSYVKDVPGSSNENVLSNTNNPYEISGEVVQKACFKLIPEIKAKKGDLDSLRSQFVAFLFSSLPESVLHPDTTDYIKFESTLQREMMNIFFNEGLDQFISKSMQIENIVVCSDYLSDAQKKRVLIFSSVLRHGLSSAHTLLTNSKNESGPGWEQFVACLRGKFQDLQDCESCFLEKIVCALMWPECFGVWVVDCAIYIIFVV